MRKILCLMILFTASCASWNPMGKSPQSCSHTFTVQFPEQWKKMELGKHLMITREGPFSQYILVQERHVDQAFGHTRKKINRGMLPQEAAEVVLDEIASDRYVLDFQVLENLPATVNQYDGFRIVFTYRTKDGSVFKTLYYGLLHGEWFYSLRYNAAEGHYSDEDVETFKKVLESFEIRASRSA